MQIIEKWANEKVIETIIYNIAGESPELSDLAQDLYVSLFEKPDELIQKLEAENSYKFFISKMVMHNVYSANSPYYYKYKRFKNLTEDYDKNDYEAD